MHRFNKLLWRWTLCGLTACAGVDGTDADPNDPAGDVDMPTDEDEDPSTGNDETPAAGEDGGGGSDPGDPPPADGGDGDGPDEPMGMGCMATGSDLISDFETGLAKANDVLAPLARGGTSYFYYNDKTPTGVLDPAKVASMPLAAAAPGTCGTYSFRLKASGFTGWGAGVGVDFMPKVGEKKVGFDASGYTGVAFYAKVAGTAAQFFVNMQDMNTHADGGKCTVESSPTQCDPYGGAITIGPEWELKTIPFAALKQRGFGLAEAAFDAKAVVNFRLQAKGDFELFLDHVHFVK
jgi:hypothetical protein